MAPSNLSAKKYVISTAFATTLALTPIVGSTVFASAGSSEGDISYEESNLPEIHEEQSSGEAPSATVNTNLIQQGDNGSHVEGLQEILQEQGYYSYNVDGIFGDITEQAVRDFQADQGLQADGIVGANTSDALALPAEPNETAEEPAEEETTGDGDIVIEETGNTDDSSDSEETAVSATGANVVEAAESVLGVPYQWAGTTASGLDSSGFINYVFNQVGVDVSRTHRDMWVNDGVHVDSPSVGDVVFFEGTYDVDGASHSGIYIGDNQMIHAGDDGVVVADISIDYWQNHYIGAKSFIQ